MPSKYFSNKLRPFPRKNSKQTFHLDKSHERFYELSFREGIVYAWNKFRTDLGEGVFSYDDLEKAKATIFIEAIELIMNNPSTREKVTVNLNSFAQERHFVRAAKIGANEEVTFDRFLPKAEKMTSANRFSPKGIEWLYLGFDYYIERAQKCCYSEVRATDKSNVKYCEFRYSGRNCNVINLSIADEKTLDDICSPYGTSYDAAGYLIAELYFKILSQEIFLPVDSKDKDLEYAPFHCMSAYFKSLGFDGIIYKSTVSDVGKNLVMFDKISFLPERIF